MATSAHAIMQRLPGGQEKWRLWAIRGTNILLIMLCASTLAKIAWSMWPVDTIQAPPPNTTGTKTSTSQPIDLNVIYNSHLFGRKEISKSTPDNKPIDAPETRLNLTLTGIMAASGDNQSRALIKDSSGKQRPYAIGDDLPGNARLSSIQSDRVILERAGRYETLRLEKKQLGGKKQANNRKSSQRADLSPLPGAGADLSAATAAKLGEARNAILQDPTKASQYIRVQPVYNQGQLKGYRVYPGKDRALFKDVGLRAGELLTSVNGVQLDDPTKALQMLTDLSQASEFNMTLERSGQTRTLNINLNQ